jgi:hypothetical protein
MLKSNWLNSGIKFLSIYLSKTENIKQVVTPHEERPHSYDIFFSQYIKIKKYSNPI